MIHILRDRFVTLIIIWGDFLDQSWVRVPIWNLIAAKSFSLLQLQYIVLNTFVVDIKQTVFMLNIDVFNFKAKFFPQCNVDILKIKCNVKLKFDSFQKKFIERFFLKIKFFFFNFRCYIRNVFFKILESSK